MEGVRGWPEWSTGEGSVPVILSLAGVGNVWLDTCTLTPLKLDLFFHIKFKIKLEIHSKGVKKPK